MKFLHFLAQKQHNELELNKARNEIQKLIEGAAADRERAQRLAIELDDSERVRKVI